MGFPYDRRVRQVSAGDETPALPVAEDDDRNVQCGARDNERAQRGPKSLGERHVGAATSQRASATRLGASERAQAEEMLADASRAGSQARICENKIVRGVQPLRRTKKQGQADAAMF
jgi:hypothetical protein